MKSEIDSTITAVTVFRNGARVTRVGKKALEAGEHSLILSGITRYADADSFRVMGKGAAILKGIDVIQRTQTFEPEAELKDLRDELEKLETERKEVLTKIRFYETRLSQYSGITKKFATEFGKWFAAGESTMKHLTDMDKVGYSRITELKTSLREARDDLQVLDDKIGVLNQKIMRVQGKRRTETITELKVLLDVKKKTEIELDVTYQLGAAGWNPTYDVDIGESTSRLKRIAQVRNNTLEDWEDVSLEVSTASAQPVRAIDPTPYYVDVHTPVPSSTSSFGFMGRMRTAKEESAEESFDDHDLEGMLDGAPEPAPERDIYEIRATVSESISGTVIYDVPGKLTITSDSDPHPVTLTEEEFDSKRIHFWNAYAMPEVVAQDEITNGDSVILPGKVKVYAAGDFIGETSLGSIAPREKFRLGTRTSYDVKAEKKLVAKETEKAGFTRGKRRRDYHYRIELKSFSKHPLEIKVVDRIPHSNSEKIEIELEPPALEPKKFEMGVLEWETELKPESEASIEYKFSVEWEKDVTITPPLP